MNSAPRIKRRRYFPPDAEAYTAAFNVALSRWPATPFDERLHRAAKDIARRAIGIARDVRRGEECLRPAAYYLDFAAAARRVASRTQGA